MQPHIWYENPDLAEQLRTTEHGKVLCAKRKESIERVFRDAKEKCAMLYTHLRELARVTNWITLKFACINLKGWQYGAGAARIFAVIFSMFVQIALFRLDYLPCSLTV